MQGHLIVAHFIDGRVQKDPGLDVSAGAAIELNLNRPAQSRARAANVVTLIKQGLDNPSRIDARGVGPSQPRYTPEDEPENQARNRRVEIVYRRGS